LAGFLPQIWQNGKTKPKFGHQVVV